MLSVLYGIFGGALGLALLFFGYRFANILLVVWAASSGYLFGAVLQAYSSGDDITSNFAGVLIAAIFAIGVGSLAAMFTSGATVAASALASFWLLNGLFLICGVSSGFAAALAAIGAAAVGWVSVALDFPRILLMLTTSILGTFWTIGAVQLFIHVISLNIYQLSAPQRLIAHSWAWMLLALCLITVSSLVQWSIEKSESL